MAFIRVQKKTLAIRMNKNKIDQNFRKYNQIIKTENQKTERFREKIDLYYGATENP